MYSSLKWGLLASVLSLPIVMAACTAGPSEEKQQELTQNLQGISQEVQGVQEEITNLSTAIGHVGTHIQEIEESSDRLLLDTSRVGISRAGFLPNPPAGQVTVQFLAEVENDGLPGNFTFHLAPEGAELFNTESIPKGQSVAIGPTIKRGIAFVEPGKFYRLQVVYRNPEDKEAKFLVRGGTIDPQAALPFIRNRCWCAAIPFSVPPGGIFSRIIDVGVGPDTPPGAKAIVVFPVVPLSE